MIRTVLLVYLFFVAAVFGAHDEVKVGIPQASPLCEGDTGCARAELPNENVPVADDEKPRALGIFFKINPDMTATRVEPKGVRDGLIYVIEFLDEEGRPKQKQLFRFKNGTGDDLPPGSRFSSSELGWEGEPFPIEFSRMEKGAFVFKKVKPTVLLRPRMEEAAEPPKAAAAPSAAVHNQAGLAFLQNQWNEAKQAEKTKGKLKRPRVEVDEEEETPNERATRLREEEAWRDIEISHRSQLNAMRRHSGQDPSYEIDFNEYKRGSKVADATKTSLYALSTGGKHIEFYDLDELGNPVGRTKLAMQLDDWDPIRRTRLSEPYREKGGKQTFLPLNDVGSPTGIFKQLIDAGLWDWVFMKPTFELTRAERQYYLDKESGKLRK